MATDKQINYARTLNIENPEQYETKALSAKIDEAMRAKGITPKPYVKPSQNGSIQASIPSVSSIVMNKTDRPHSYEFGKVGNRHKVYYNTVEELLLHVEALISAELVEEEIKDFSKGVVM